MSRLSSFVALAAIAALTGGASAADYRGPLFPSSVAPVASFQAPVAVSYQAPSAYRAPTLTYPAYHPTFQTPALPLSVPAFVGFDQHANAGPVAGESIELYPNVKIRDRHHIACCAEMKLIQVPDPCWQRDKCNRCPQKHPCVFVAINVPKVAPCHQHAAPAPCCAPKPSCAAPAFHRHNICGCAPKVKPCNKCHACGSEHRKLRVISLAGGKYQKYDYGKYRVEVRVKRGYVEVDYDD